MNLVRKRTLPSEASSIEIGKYERGEERDRDPLTRWDGMNLF